MNGQFRHTGNNRHKTQSKDKHYKHITQKTEKMSNNHHTKKQVLKYCMGLHSKGDNCCYYKPSVEFSNVQFSSEDDDISTRISVL